MSRANSSDMLLAMGLTQILFVIGGVVSTAFGFWFIGKAGVAFLDLDFAAASDCGFWIMASAAGIGVSKKAFDLIEGIKFPKDTD